MFDNQKSVIGNGAVIMQGTNDWFIENDNGCSQYTLAVGSKVTVLHASASVANKHYAYFFKTPELPKDIDLTDFTQNLFDIYEQKSGEVKNVVELIQIVAGENNLEPVSVIAPSTDGDINLSTSVQLNLNGDESAEAFNGEQEALNADFINNMLPSKLLDTAFVAGLKIT